MASQRTVVGAPFTFSDGTTLPEGSRFCFPAAPSQTDPAHFQDPLKFDGYRFLRLAEADGCLNNGGVNVWAAHQAGPTNMA